MNIGIIGGGILGLSLGHYLQRQGHHIEIFERNGYLGGLACSFDYGPFVWDKFYHVILPQDGHILDLLEDLGLSGDLRWRATQTGFYTGGTFYPMSNTRQLLQFPLLSLPDKLRMGLATLYATRMARASDLYQVTAAEWLSNVFGASNYKQFWKPLLRAKFGVYADQVAAVTIHATLQRLFGARSAVASRESMGYVRGGYDRIIKVLRERLERRGALVHAGVRIERIGDVGEVALEPAFAVAAGGARWGGRDKARTRPQWSLGRDVADAGDAIVVDYITGSGGSETRAFDKVVFTGPQQTASSVVTGTLRERLANDGRDTGASRKYLGVICLNVVLRRELTPYYVLNIADDQVPLTGVIEMTALVDRMEETEGLSLVYLPRYLDCEDPFLRADDRAVYDELFTNGLKRLFPGLTPADVVSWHVQRAPFVQPLQFVTSNVPPPGNRIPDVTASFVLANTACLACPTLNNNEVVGLAKEVALRF